MRQWSHAPLFMGKSPREAAKCCFSKPVARQRKLVGPIKKNYFFFYYQTLIYVVADEPHPLPHYQRASSPTPTSPYQSCLSLPLLLYPVTLLCNIQTTNNSSQGLSNKFHLLLKLVKH